MSAMAGGIGIMLKSMGIDPEMLQKQMQAFGSGLKEFSDRINGIQQQLYVLEGKIDALHMALDARMPDAQGYDLWPGVNDPAPMPRLVMDNPSIEATKQHAPGD